MSWLSLSLLVLAHELMLFPIAVLGEESGTVRTAVLLHQQMDRFEMPPQIGTSALSEEPS